MWIGTDARKGIQPLYSDSVDISCYERLANAIIIQAVKDYKAELHKLVKNPHNKEAMGKALDLENFFYSPWFGMLTNLSPDTLLRGIREMVKEEAEKRRRQRLERMRRKEAEEQKRAVAVSQAAADFIQENKS